MHHVEVKREAASKRLFSSGATSIAIAVALVIGGGATAAAPAPTTTHTLQEEKLREEIRQLRIQNDRAGSVREELLVWAPFITVLVGVFGVVLPVVREVRQQRDQRAGELEQRRVEEERRLDQRAAELEQRRIEERRRFDSLFAQAVADLGSKRESVQVSAAIALQSFLRAEYEEFHPQIHAVLCANLAIDHSPLVNRFIVRAFQISIRLHLLWRRQQHDPTPLDLANCHMPRVDLEGLDLGERADIAFASFARANLRGAQLFRAEGYEAVLDGAHISRRANLREARLHGASCVRTRFHDADLMASQFRRTRNKRADLSRAEFYQAKLQGAHFEGAILNGAKFRDANVTEAFFYGAEFDDEALRSMVDALVVKDKPTWKRAYFDPATAARLEEAAQRAVQSSRTR